MHLRILLITILLNPVLGFSQSNQNTFSNISEEVIVTARKREEGSQSVPISISAFSGETLEEVGIFTYEDLDRVSPNLQVVKNGAYGTAAVTIRGVGGSGFSVTSESQAATYIDGIYVSRTQGNFLDLWDLDRVEVLKGPQGTLFGKNSTVGAVSFFYNKPSLEGEDFKVRIGAGSDSRDELAFMANLPISANSGLRVSYSSERQDGYIYNNTLNNFSGEIDAETLRVSGLYNFNDDITLNFSHVIYNRDGSRALGACKIVAHPLNGSGAVGINASALMGAAAVADPTLAAAIQNNCNASVPGVSGTSLSSPRVEDDLERTTLDFNYSNDYGNLKLLIGSTQLDSLNGNLGLSVGGNRPLNALPSDGKKAAGYLDPRDIVNDANANQIELRWSGKALNGKLDYVIGAYTFDEAGINQLDTMYYDGVGTDETQATVDARANIMLASVFALLGKDCSDPATQARYCATVQSLQAFSSQQTTFAENDSTAYFFEGTYALNDKTNMTLGFRTSKENKMVKTYSDAIIPGLSNGFGGVRSPVAQTCSQTFFQGTALNFGPAGTFYKDSYCLGNEEFKNDSFRFAVDYSLNNDSLIYFSYAKGFASGGFSNDDKVTGFPAETADNYEIGTKGTYLNNRLQLNANLFFFEYVNNQRTIGKIAQNGVASIVTVPIQKAEVDGYEIELKLSLTDNLSLLSSRGVYGGKYKEFFDDSGNDFTKYAYDAEGPESRTNFTFLHNFSLRGGSLLTSLSWTHVGDDFTTTELYDYSQLHSYSTLDFNSSWQISDSQTISLIGKNITDELYGYAQFGDPFLASFQTTYYAPGEEWKLTYQQSF